MQQGSKALHKTCKSLVAILEFLLLEKPYRAGGDL
jgi:hypothetical protein